MSARAVYRHDTRAPAGQQDHSRLLAGRDPDGNLDVLAGAIEVVYDPAVVRIAGGVEAWIHPGNVVDVAPGAIVHLAPGAHLEEDPDPAFLASGQVTVTPWNPTISTRRSTSPHPDTTADVLPHQVVTAGPAPQTQGRDD